MKLSTRKLEKRDIPVIVLCAVGGFFLVLFALAKQDLAAGIFAGLVAGVPSGAGGGVLVCVFRRFSEGNHEN
jgi:hypothetical protein